MEPITVIIVGLVSGFYLKRKMQKFIDENKAKHYCKFSDFDDGEIIKAKLAERAEDKHIYEGHVPKMKKYTCRKCGYYIIKWEES